MHGGIALILVDTSVWLQLQHPEGEKERQEIVRIVDRDELATTGMILAEVLQGARSENEYKEWSDRMSGPHFYSDTRETWESAGRLSYELRRRGQQTALSDLVIATVAIENDLEVYANDSDFDHVPGLRRYVP
jgi:predicted nucleic acid-binding protein